MRLQDIVILCGCGFAALLITLAVFGWFSDFSSTLMEEPVQQAELRANLVARAPADDVGLPDWKDCTQALEAVRQRALDARACSAAEDCALLSTGWPVAASAVADLTPAADRVLAICKTVRVVIEGLSFYGETELVCQASRCMLRSVDVTQRMISETQAFLESRAVGG